ncbi:hypothetical protein RRG08_035682 [Elysia crispata]|uniref:Caveolin n=1 Tax=Elysia crispata TaxID=231223 RepID=A0AAE1CV76_9GAST|nr:hypothetical protein RRG08_035682 [Elysia crispata]
MILDPTCCKFEISLNSLEMFGEGDGKGCRKKWIMKPMTISTPNYAIVTSGNSKKTTLITADHNFVKIRSRKFRTTKRQIFNLLPLVKMSSGHGEARVNMASEEVDLSPATKVDNQEITDRDPTRMNQHVKVIFDEVFAEPHETIHSFDSVWLTSNKVFTFTKTWCYRLTTAVCAVPLSVLWGIHFACMACVTIWCCQPCIKSYQIELSCIRGFFQSLLDAIYRPCFETMGYFFHHIRVQVRKGDDQAKD